MLRIILSGVMGLGSWLACASTALGAFSITPTQVAITATPGVDHYPVRVPVTYTGTTGPGALTATSDAAWASPTLDATTGEVVVAVTTGTLINRTNTATITVTGDGTSDTFFVRATVSPLNIVALADDPVRNRAYAVQQDGLNPGALLVFDPLAATFLGQLTLPEKPTAIAVNAAGTEAFVICSVARSISIIDLATLRVSGTLTLPAYTEWGANDTFARIALGRNNIIYYTDSAWAPVLRVLDRTTGQLIQTVTAAHDSMGFGNIGVSRDGSTLVTSVQFGWSAGTANSYAVRFSLGADGRLTFADRSSTAMSRDPLNTPTLFSDDGAVVFVKQAAFASDSVVDPVRTFPGPIFSITPGGEIAAGSRAIHDVATGNVLAELPVAATVQTITSDYARLLYFDSTARRLQSFDLLAAIGPELLGRNTTPADDSIALAPSQLRWSPLPGVDRYRVYFGTDDAAVDAAGPSSPLLLGEAQGSALDLATTLAPGTRYFWRVDPLQGTEATRGPIYSFTVSSIATSVGRVVARTVQGHADYIAEIALTSATADEAWTATGSHPWIKPTATSGTTPATLAVTLDASQLAAGTHTGSITLGTPTGNLTLPVQISVDPLALTVIRSDPASGLVYGISEAEAGGTSRAYLLEIDTAAKAIARVVPAGRTVTDLAIHAGDHRIYVTNWRVGSVLAFDRTTLALARTLAFLPFTSIGYGDGDAYRIAAGGAGRLIVEEMDQWIDISLYDTVNGTTLAKAFAREGGGQYAPDLRHYYHGENNSSGARLRKYDTLADAFTEVASARVEHTTYYGSRTVVVSENGNRIFWAGGVFRPDLTEEWALKDIIYSASPDGRYAFSETKIYDVDAQKVVLGMPANTRVSAYNGTTQTLVTQVGARLAFHQVGTSIPHPAPVLSVASVTHQTIALSWTDESLETGFTLQRRAAGTTAWTDVTPSPAANTTSQTITGLAPLTSLEFRIKADGNNSSSEWSNVAVATTTAAPPATPSISAASATASSITLQVQANAAAATFDNIVIERSPDGSTGWTAIATGSTSAFTHIDTGLSPSTTYYYRARSFRGDLASAYAPLTWRSTSAPDVSPTITVAPVARTVYAGGATGLSVSAQGGSLTYQWFRGETALPGATNSTLVLNPITSADAGSYTVLITNSAGSIRSAPAEITVLPAPVVAAQVFFGTFAQSRGRWALALNPDRTGTFIGYLTQPQRSIVTTVSLDTDNRFRVPLHLGLTTPAASPQSTAPTTAADSPHHLDGQVVGNTVFGLIDGLALSFGGNADTVTSGTRHPLPGWRRAEGLGGAASSLHVITGPGRNFLAVIHGPDPDGGIGRDDIGGYLYFATARQRTLTLAQPWDAPSLSGFLQLGESHAEFVSLPPAHLRDDRFINVSSRGRSGGGDDVLIAGFVIQGDQPRTVLIRGAGPALTLFGVPNAAANPGLVLVDAGGDVILQNDDWHAAANAAETADAFTATGAFPFGADSLDAAMLVTLPPGSYTALTRVGAGGGRVVLTEVYDATLPRPAGRALSNLSIRGESGTGDDVLTAGFVIEGDTPKRVLVRAIGPTLADFQLPPETLLQDPVLTIYQGPNALVSNDDWSADAANIILAHEATGAFALPPGSKDAVLMLTLEPGLYTAQAAGKSGGTGVALVEVYQLD